MARPKTYRREDALRSACEVFWQFGYKGLSVRALEEKTNINQFALQNDFGGKENLYLEALEFYVAETDKAVLKPLREGGIEEIDHFFYCLGNPETTITSKWGCMVVNAGIDNAKVSNKKIAHISTNYWKSLTAAFSAALTSAKRNNTIAQEINVRKSANALVVAAMGIHTCNRINQSLTAGVPLVSVIRSTIAGWRVE